MICFAVSDSEKTIAQLKSLGERLWAEPGFCFWFLDGLIWASLPSKLRLLLDIFSQVNFYPLSCEINARESN